MADEQNDAIDFSIFDLPEGGNPLVEKEAVVEKVSPEVKPQEEKPLATDVIPPKSEEKVAEQPPKTEEAKEPKKVELTDDDLVPVLVDGKVEHVRWGDYKGSVMRQADYTRKTTQVADGRKKNEERERELTEVAGKLQQREESLVGIFAEKAKLDALYDQLYPGQRLAAPGNTKVEAPAGPAADDLVTHGDMTKTRDETIAEARKAAQAEVLAAEQKRNEQLQQEADKRELAGLVSTVEETLDAVLKEHGESLGHIPHIDKIIKQLAWDDHQPKTRDEMKTAIVAAGKKLAEIQADRNREVKKQEALKKGSLEKGIESGGATPARERKALVNNEGKVDWDESDRDAIAFIESKLGR
jgi:hypothetical protein